MLVTLHAFLVFMVFTVPYSSRKRKANLRGVYKVRKTFLVTSEATSRKGNKSENARREMLAGGLQILLL